jgi:hypothetical protein
MNIRKIIKEELLKEVGGYDDPNIMAIHGGKTIGILSQVYSEMTNTIRGLSQLLMDNPNKEEVVQALEEVVREIDLFVMTIKQTINDFTEDELIEKAKMVMVEMRRFQNKLRILVNLSDSLVTGDEEFIDRVMDFLMNLMESVREYGEELKLTAQDFSGRFTGRNRGSFGGGFDLN